MRTAQICPTCATYTNAVCVIYDGIYLSNINVSPGDDLETILASVDSTIDVMLASFQPLLGFTPEDVANKSTSVIIDQASNTKYPSVKAVFDWVVANFTPVLGFTPENVANKSTNIVTDQASNTKYPSVKAVFDWATATFQPVLGFTPENVANKSTDNTLGGLTPSNTLYPTQKAVKDFITTNTWSLTGNAGTNDTVNFIGTTDAQDLVLVANTIERLRLDVATGNVISQSTGDTGIVSRCLSNNSYVTIGATFVRKGFVDISNGTNVAQITATNCTNTRSLNLPDSSGTLVVSVNGAFSDAQGNVTVPRPYKVYTAVISQQLTNAPTVDYVLENTLGFTPTFAYVSPGKYTIDNTSFGWTDFKTVVFFTPGYMPSGGPGIDAGVVIGWERNSTTTITMTSKKTSTDADTNGLIYLATIEIRVYP